MTTFPATATPAPPRGAWVSTGPDAAADTALRRAVLARLVADPLVSTDHIEVSANSGHVTLAGYVTSNAQKAAARAATGRVTGVCRVADRLVVAIPCPPWP